MDKSRAHFGLCLHALAALAKVGVPLGRQLFHFCQHCASRRRRIRVAHARRQARLEEVECVFALFLVDRLQHSILLSGGPQGIIADELEVRIALHREQSHGLMRARVLAKHRIHVQIFGTTAFVDCYEVVTLIGVVDHAQSVSGVFNRSDALPSH